MAYVIVDEMRHFFHISEESHFCIKFQIHDTCTFANRKFTTYKTVTKTSHVTFFFEAAPLTLLELKPAPGDSFQLKRNSVLDCPISFNDLCQFTVLLTHQIVLTKESKEEKDK